MINVLLVDDEEVGMEVIHILLSAYEDIYVCGKYTNPYDALDHVDHHDVDAIFLDIEMPELSGINLAERIKKKNPAIHIIFVTAHKEFALEAFDVYSLDYILKPVTKQRLAKSVSRLKSVVTHQAIMQEVSIRTFGDFEVTQALTGQPFIWKTSKVRELCAFFVHHEGGKLDRDYIIDTLWPDVSVDKAKTNLYTCISYLRKVFKENGVDQIILKNGSAYYMELNQVSCDSVQWSQIISQGKYDQESAEKLLVLYTGDYMGMMGFHWAEEKREQIVRQMIEVLRNLEGDYRASGMVKEVLICLEKQFELSPYSDDVCQRLMNAYVDAGNRREAVMVYRRFAKLLEEDIGLQPSSATEALLTAIMRR